MQLDEYHVFPRYWELGSEIKRQYKTVPATALERSQVLLRELDPDRVAKLKESIRAMGILTPLLVKPKGSRYEVLDGVHRLAALEALVEEGQAPQHVPVVVVWAENPNAEYGLYVMAIEANVERSDEFSVAEALRRLIAGVAGGDRVLTAVEEATRRLLSLSDPRAYVEQVLEVGEPTPQPPPSIDEETRLAMGEGDGVFWLHFALFMLEGLVPRERILEEVARAFTATRPVASTPPARPTGPRTVVIELPEVRTGRDFKKYVRNASKVLTMSLRGLRITKADLERHEVRELIVHLREAVELAEALRREAKPQEPEKTVEEAHGVEATPPPPAPIEGSQTGELEPYPEPPQAVGVAEEEIPQDLAREILEEAQREL